jgi:hypothetical protein
MLRKPTPKKESKCALGDDATLRFNFNFVQGLAERQKRHLMSKSKDKSMPKQEVIFKRLPKAANHSKVFMARQVGITER